MYLTLNIQRNILTNPRMHIDTYPTTLQIKVIILKSIIFQMLETKVCTFKKLHSDILKMDLFLKAFLLNKDFQSNKIFTQIKHTEIIVMNLIHSKIKVGEISRKINLIYIKINQEWEIKHGSILTLQERFKICINHGSPKILPHLLHLSF